MYSYTYDEQTGGILLNSTPTVFSKEPRPVYAPELDILGFDQYWNYDKQSEIPYMWAESNQYWYRGVNVAKLKGGDLYHAPEIIIPLDENGNRIMPEPIGASLRTIDISEMIRKNVELLDIVEGTTVKKIVSIYEKYCNKLDIFHVAFSGGKDSAVLLDLVKKSLPKKSFVVVFGDTGMEFPDTYKTVEITRQSCEKDDIPFYVSKSHLEPCESWKLFGPPARVLRWCCSVHKSTPQTLVLREITKKKDYTGLDFVGVRKHESVARSTYDYENFGKKQKGQYSFNAILDWTSAEIWLYLFAYNLPINAAYKKGNSRAGCLFCPMGGGRGDYLQYKCYPDEVSKYLDLIMLMNARDKDDISAQKTYISNGGWNARKNGRDLSISESHYKEEVIKDKLVITVINPSTNWQEWINTVGTVPFSFDYKELKNGYQIICDEAVIKKYPKEIKRFKQVFHKAAYCVGCKVCETNCRKGCISFINGLSITGCTHCGQCHEIDDGCLVYHSLKTSNGGGKMKASINSFANHSPKPEWVNDFFNLKNSYWDSNTLGPNQVPLFKRFLRECQLIDGKNNTTPFFELVSNMGSDSLEAWGLIISNLAYNSQFKWYITNFDIGIWYERENVADMLINDGVSKDDATSIINAYKRFCELPIGTVCGWGNVVEQGRQIKSLVRTKCMLSNNLVVLYSLFVFAEKCNSFKEFTLAWLMNDGIDRDGISPTRIFGLDYEEMKSILMGLSAKYPEFIDATFTNDLDKITLMGKTSQDVLDLFKEGK